jgi:hypothetical protein
VDGREAEREVFDDIPVKVSMWLKNLLIHDIRDAGALRALVFSKSFATAAAHPSI